MFLNDHNTNKVQSEDGLPQNRSSNLKGPAEVAVVKVTQGQREEGLRQGLLTHRPVLTSVAQGRLWARESDMGHDDYRQ